jgi:hypothetical protein
VQYILKDIKRLQETVISCNYFQNNQNEQLFLFNPKQFFEHSINIEHDLCFQTFVSWSNAICHFSFSVLFILQVKDGENV